MRKLFNIISLATIFLLAGCQQKNVASLSFYIVSDEKIDDGQFIDTTNFPKLGYIHATPDLVITKLQSVAPTVAKSQMINVDTNGKQTLGKEMDQQAVVIFMQQDDAKKFTSLTEHAVGKQLLLMLGETPLMAPRVNEPIETPSFQISLGKQADQNDQKKIEDELQQLVR